MQRGAGKSLTVTAFENRGRIDRSADGTGYMRPSSTPLGGITSIELTLISTLLYGKLSDIVHLHRIQKKRIFCSRISFVSLAPAKIAEGEQRFRRACHGAKELPESPRALPVLVWRGFAPVSPFPQKVASTAFHTCALQLVGR